MTEATGGAQGPGWFQRALAIEPEVRSVEVGGTPINYLRWADDEAKPGLVLVHGRNRMGLILALNVVYVLAFALLEWKRLGNSQYLIASSQ